MEKRPLIELTRYRKGLEKPLSLRELAAHFGVSAATISRWETGKRSPDARHLTKISTLTEVPILELMGLRQ